MSNIFTNFVIYGAGFRDATSGNKNLRLSKMYDLGFTEGLAAKYKEQINQQDDTNLHLIDKDNGIYEE